MEDYWEKETKQLIEDWYDNLYNDIYIKISTSLIAEKNAFIKNILIGWLFGSVFPIIDFFKDKIFPEYTLVIISIFALLGWLNYIPTYINNVCELYTEELLKNNNL